MQFVNICYFSDKKENLGFFCHFVLSSLFWFWHK